jgi:hypothetical protein
MLATEAGELREFISAEALAEKKHKRTELNMCKTIDDLKQYAKKNGYKPAWVRIRARLKNIK